MLFQPGLNRWPALNPTAPATDSPSAIFRVLPVPNPDFNDAGAGG